MNGQMRESISYSGNQRLFFIPDGTTLSYECQFINAYDR